MAALPYRLHATRLRRLGLGAIFARQREVCRGRARRDRGLTGDRARAGLSLRAAAENRQDGGGPMRSSATSGTSRGPTAKHSASARGRKRSWTVCSAATCSGFTCSCTATIFSRLSIASIESRVDYERFSVTRGSHETNVRPFPISIDMEGHLAERPLREATSARSGRAFGLRDEWAIALGVDRMDYTKGHSRAAAGRRPVSRALSRVAQAVRVPPDGRAEPASRSPNISDLNDEVDRLAAADQRETRRRRLEAHLS